MLPTPAFELTFTLLWHECTMTDSVSRRIIYPPPPTHGLPSIYSVMQLTPFTNHHQLYTSAACQHLPGALTRPACNEKLSLLASTQQVRRPLGQLLGNATDLVVRESQTNAEVWLEGAHGWIDVQCRWKSWQKRVKLWV